MSLPLRATFSPTRPLARRDVPLARARAFQFSLPLSRGVAEAALYCAHRATTASSWGLCEQEGHLATPSLPSYRNVAIVTPSPPSARSPARNSAT